MSLMLGNKSCHRTHLDAIHVIPGDSTNKLVEEIVSSKTINYGVTEIYETNQTMRKHCEKLGIPFRSLGFNEKNLSKQFVSLAYSIVKDNPKIIFLHSFYPSLLGIGLVFLFPRIKVVSVRHHNQVHILSNNRKGIFLDRIIARVTHTTVAVSSAVKDTMISQGCKPEKIVIIYNGIKSSRLVTNRVQNNSRNPRLRLLAAGRIDWQKNYETMLQVVAELNRLGVDFNLTILGSGNESYESKLIEMTAKLNLNEKVSWLGWQPRVEEWFAESDIFLHTALDEACPLILIEALLIGIPIVSSNSGGSREVLSPLYLGCPSKDVAFFVNQILLTWDNIVEIRSAAESYIPVIENKFGSERMSREYELRTLELLN
jgi:glycosyltransferase involved in cell wall biosynthesis